MCAWRTEDKEYSDDEIDNINFEFAKAAESPYEPTQDNIDSIYQDMFDHYFYSREKPDSPQEQYLIDLEKKVRDLSGRLDSSRTTNKELRGQVTELKSQLTTERKSDGNKRNWGIGMMSERIPPQCIDVERALLGTYILNPELMDYFSQPYLNDLLYSTQNKHIHKSMIDLGKKLNSTTLASDLRQKGLIDAVGSEHYIDELVKAGKPDGKEVTKDIALEYSRRIENEGLKRQVISLCSEVTTLMFDLDFNKNFSSAAEYIRSLSLKVLDLLPFRYRLREDLANVTDSQIITLKNVIARKGRPEISTGYKALDRITHGILPRKLIVNGASNKVGKTSFTLNIADNVAKQGYHSAIFTFESSDDELVQMLLSRHAGVNREIFEYYDENKHDEVADKEFAKINTVREEVGKLPIHIDYSSAKIDYVISKSRELKSRHPNLALIVIDGLQAFGKYVPLDQNLAKHFYNSIQRMKEEIANELEVTVMLNTQLKGKVLLTKTKRPNSTDDFADCKGLPDVCDTALGIYRPEVFFPDEKYKDWMEVISLGLRSGDTWEKQERKRAKLNCNMSYCNIFEN